MIKKFEPIILKIIGLLVSRNYLEISNMTKGIRMSSAEIANAISEYGRKLIAPPAEIFNVVDILRVKNEQYEQYSICVPLWTIEEGRSDLTMELTVKIKGDLLEVELDDIHVL